MLVWSRRLIRRYAQVVLAALLFTQFAIGGQACVLPGMDSAMSIAAGAASEPCQGMNRNLCLLQTLLPDQTLDTAHTALPAPSFAPLFVAFPAPPATPQWPPSKARSGSDPSICLRMCRLLL